MGGASSPPRTAPGRSAAWRKDQREERTLAQLRDAQIDVTGLRDKVRGRDPLRCLTRESVRSYRAAPITSAASASISSCSTVGSPSVSAQPVRTEDLADGRSPHAAAPVTPKPTTPAPVRPVPAARRRGGDRPDHEHVHGEDDQRPERVVGQPQEVGDRAQRGHGDADRPGPGPPRQEPPSRPRPRSARRSGGSSPRWWRRTGRCSCGWSHRRCR
jgi:hypothetical protein